LLQASTSKSKLNPKERLQSADALDSFPNPILSFLSSFGGFMSIVPTLQQTYLRIFPGLKAQTENHKKRQQDSVLSCRQKLGEPAPLASNPVLQMELNKAYRAYQKIILDMIHTYQKIEDLCQDQIAFLDRIIDQVRTSEITFRVVDIVNSLRSQMEPLDSQVLQLQRNLHSEQAAMTLLAHEEGTI
jgi:hypothetical protein